MTSPARIARRSAPVSIRRRRSPSVKMPATRPLRVAHRREAEALAGHLVQHLGHHRAGIDARHGVAAAHQVDDVHQELPAQAAAGMRAREVLLAKAARIEQRDRERVAERHLRRRARGRREVERARLLVDRARDDDLGVAAEAALDVAGHRDQRHAEALDRRHDGGDLVALARVGDREDDVAGGHHAEIAVARFAGMDEERRRPRRGQRRRHLAADVAALAHSHHDDAPAAGEDRARARRRSPRPGAPSARRARAPRCRASRARARAHVRRRRKMKRAP